MRKVRLLCNWVDAHDGRTPQVVALHQHKINAEKVTLMGQYPYTTEEESHIACRLAKIDARARSSAIGYSEDCLEYDGAKCFKVWPSVSKKRFEVWEARLRVLSEGIRSGTCHGDSAGKLADVECMVDDALVGALPGYTIYVDDFAEFPAFEQSKESMPAQDFQDLRNWIIGNTFTASAVDQVLGPDDGKRTRKELADTIRGWLVEE
jgi:hypothetical protein